MIGKLVTQALLRMREGDPVMACLSICPAVEPTARAEYPKIKKAGPVFRKFIDTNVQIVSTFGFPPMSVEGAFRIGVTEDYAKANGMANERDQDGHVSIGALLYHVVRCGIMHAPADFGRYVQFEKGTVIAAGEPIRLQPDMPMGLVMAVVTSPTNAKERLEDGADFTCRLMETTLRINELWGKRKMVLKLLQQEKERILLRQLRGRTAVSERLDAASGPQPWRK